MSARQIYRENLEYWEKFLVAVQEANDRLIDSTGSGSNELEDAALAVQMIISETKNELAKMEAA